MDAEVAAAWISAAVTVGLAAIGVIVRSVQAFRESRERQKRERLQYRREALVAALRVVDHVYANTAWTGQAPAAHNWPVTELWDALNLMILYCEDADRTTRAFLAAIGTTGPSQLAVRYGPKELVEFRKVVCKELGLPETTFADSDRVWVAGAAGAIPPGGVRNVLVPPSTTPLSVTNSDTSTT